jgi:hypothetical protein
MDYNDKFNSSFSNDNEYENKSSLHDIKLQSDKRYCVINKRVMVSENFYKNIKIELYGSGDIGTTIRDAETGNYYKGHLVGSAIEDLYFKISHSRSRNFNINTNSNNHIEPLILFYQSPEHYERHQHVELNNLIKQKWHSKKNKYLQEHNLN